MKQIENVYEALRMLEYLSDNGKGITKDDLAPAVGKLRNFVLAQEIATKPGGKVDIRKWCSTDKGRPAMCNVAYFTRMKEAVASDLVSLIVSRVDYFDPMPGAVLRREGEPYEYFQIDEKDGWVKDGRYPDYKNVIPEDPVTVEIEPRETIAERLRRVKAALKYDPVKNAKGVIIFKVGPWWFKFGNLEKLLSLPGWGLSASGKRLEKEDASRLPALYRDSDYDAVFMPVLPPREEEPFKGIEGVAFM